MPSPHPGGLAKRTPQPTPEERQATALETIATQLTALTLTSAEIRNHLKNIAGKLNK